MGLKSVALGDGMVYMAPGEYKKGITVLRWAVSVSGWFSFILPLCKGET